MSRFLYSFAWCLALPLLLLRLWQRGRAEPGYRQHVAERFGWYRRRTDSGDPLICVHAVSVGETRAAKPLIDALLTAYPTHRILLTHMTATGRATGAALFAQQLAGPAPRLEQCFLPYDSHWGAARFVRHFRPCLCVLMETEVWPNLIAQCARHAVPVALVNARLSARSLARGQRWPALFRAAAAGLSCVAAQTDADAERLAQLGAQQVQVTGSLKFDVAPPVTARDDGVVLRRQLGARPLLLCASTRDGEEELILDAWRSIAPAAALLVIVPRHPQRFAQVAQMIAQRQLICVRRSQMDGAVIDTEVQVVLGDSMGELFAWYAAADLAFIGGSLLPLGGQNLIEACALGTPVLLGPHTFNFAAISDAAVAAGAALRVTDAAALMAQARQLFADAARQRAMAQAALAFAEEHRGATARTMALLARLL